MKCSCCGEEVGSASVCPVCGSSVTPRTAPAYVPSYRSSAAARAPQPAAAPNAEGILQQIAKEKTALVEECGKAVSKIIVDCGNMLSTGTGWCGYKDYVITNAHVVENMKNGKGKSITIEFSDKLALGAEQKVPADLVYYSRVEDIAILLPKSGRLPRGVKVLRIEDKPTKQGELVFTIGNPLHYKFTYMEGAVSNPNYEKKGSGRKFTVLQTTLTLNHGNSGGPVMNTAGDIVGMATFGELEAETKKTLDPLGLLAGREIIKEETVYKDIAGYGFCVKSEAILAAIKEIEN